MYNALIVSVFKVMDIGYIECKNLVAIPSILKCHSTDVIFYSLLSQREDGISPLLAAKFVEIRNLKLLFVPRFKILRNKYEIVEESNWYINPTYDRLELKEINKLAEPSILLQSDTQKIKHYLNYYINLRLKGYDEEEALNMIYS